ncbi:expressed protein [Chlorella variabilis]|uniref:Expressed protein n=1 Tax=Chlorella variabilis TaxID=554065 RepID=E1Z346_CHLVA|nr:expressed protein [Chlorella variabilis]EFN59775.1 expressed protein [Chlorella variabilis]|eukprot:XP_005851877.1 expressed protein [Chlorella variabilis]
MVRGSQRGEDGGLLASQRWQPRQPGGEGGRGAPGRQPGAMSQLLADRPPPRGDRERRARQPWRRGQQQRREGEEGNELVEVEDASVTLPAELLDTPHDIITQFEYALRDAADPQAEAVPIRDLVTDIGDLANSDNLALLKYYVTPQEWRAFSSGSMDTEEQNHLLDRLATALIADERHVEKKEAVAAAIDADPDYDIMASLGSRPQLRGTRRVAPVPPREEVEAEIDASKEMLMEEHSMTEEEFEAAKQATVQQMMAAAHQAAAPVLPNHLSQERRLMALVDKALPRDHPHYAAAKQRIAVLQANPGWSQERKMVFTKRLIKRLASA